MCGGLLDKYIHYPTSAAVVPSGGSACLSTIVIVLAVIGLGRGADKYPIRIQLILMSK